MRALPTTLLVLVAAVAAAAPAWSQVREAEPFGGRPFGAPPGTPPLTGSGAAPQGTVMGGPGVSSVTAPGTPNLGTAPAMVAAPVPAPAPVVVPPQMTTPLPATATPAINPAPAPAMQAPGTTAGASTNANPATHSPVAPPAPANAAVPAPAAASVVPPFGVGQNPARNAPPQGTASTAQQPAVRGLPADAPRLVISGSVYSTDPAKRLLIVNGEVMREGADLGQGVVLREVKKDSSAVLGFKGSNYNVVF